jgi:hypothetical protein
VKLMSPRLIVVNGKDEINGHPNKMMDSLDKCALVPVPKYAILHTGLLVLSSVLQRKPLEVKVLCIECL